MRWTLTLTFMSALCMGGCFEDSKPVDTAAESGSECTDGTEGCPCIDGACIGDLSCLSNTCVDASASGDSAEDTGPDDSADSVDSGPPMTSDSSGELPPGAQCDPLLDECEVGFSCVGPGADGFYCEVHGDTPAGQPCLMVGDCGAHLVCIFAGQFSDCAGEYCCTGFCDLYDPDVEFYCPSGFFCEPYFLKDKVPGYEHVGVCVEFPA